MEKTKKHYKPKWLKFLRNHQSRYVRQKRILAKAEKKSARRNFKTINLEDLEQWNND